MICSSCSAKRKKRWLSACCYHPLPVIYLKKICASYHWILNVFYYFQFLEYKVKCTFLLKAIIFLAFLFCQVERWCPLLPGRKIANDGNSPKLNRTAVSWYVHSQLTVTKIVYSLLIVNHAQGLLVDLRKTVSIKTVWDINFLKLQFFWLITWLHVRCFSFWQDLTRVDVDRLLDMLKDDSPVKFQWIKRRITQMWPHWLTAFSSLKRKRDLTKTVQKKVCKCKVSDYLLWIVNIVLDKRQVQLGKQGDA